MREEKLFRAIGDVGDDLIARADEPVQKKKPVRWAGIAALAACCLIAVGLARLVTMSMGNTSDSTAALDAAAPETAMMQATEDAKSGSAENGAWKQESADEAMDAAANDAEAPAETEEAEWLKAHCAEYGFILRYPPEKSEITGITWEPWHFRYVGEEAAVYIMENELCLEEYLAETCAKRE